MKLSEMLPWLFKRDENCRGFHMVAYGRPGSETEKDVLFHRWALTPLTRWGQLWLHHFVREDVDNPHDHPFDFWTYPLNGYFEHVLENVDPLGGVPEKYALTTNWVSPRRWQFRAAEHTHRVMTPFWSLVWRKPDRREWGFWRDMGLASMPAAKNRPRKGDRAWYQWELYLYGHDWSRKLSADKWSFEPLASEDAFYAWHPGMADNTIIYLPRDFNPPEAICEQARREAFRRGLGR